MMPLNRGKTFAAPDTKKKNKTRSKTRTKQQQNNGTHVLSLTAEEIAQHIDYAVERIEQDLPPLHHVPQQEHNAIETVHGVLGEGGYCRVESVTVDGQVLARKRLKPDMMSSSTASKTRVQACVGTKDLRSEAAVLAGLDHEHIVKIHGVAKDKQDFFILMEQMDTTLETRMEEWKEAGLGLKEADKATSATSSSLLSPSTTTPHIGFGFHNLFVSQHHQQQQQRRLQEQQRKQELALVDTTSWQHLMEQRLPLGLDVAKALAYMHSQKVAFRDVKPANVGIRSDGTAVLLDFGLATTKRCSRECAGSRRYMPPEVVQSKRYECNAVDVYSLGIMLWYVCTLDKPYAAYTAKQHYDHVVCGGERPELPEWWPTLLRRLLERCFREEPEERPSMAQVVQDLEEIIKMGKMTETKTTTTTTTTMNETKKMASSVKRLGEELVPTNLGRVVPV